MQVQSSGDSGSRDGIEKENEEEKCAVVDGGVDPSSSDQPTTKQQ
jgi:hypothetical protein